jgi:WhiB family redox-sensing transcriptional regulator
MKLVEGQVEGQEVQPVLMDSRPRRVRREPNDLTDGELAGRVYRLARCAGSRVDPDTWFPMTWDVAKARDQAAHAIAICARCPVRPDCLELSLRHAFGSHGVWGGLVEEERRAIRRAWLAGTSVTEFLQDHSARLPRDQPMASGSVTLGSHCGSLMTPSLISQSDFTCHLLRIVPQIASRGAGQHHPSG